MRSDELRTRSPLDHLLCMLCRVPRRELDEDEQQP